MQFPYDSLVVTKRERLRKLKGLLRDDDLETVRQGIDLVCGLDDPSVFGALLEGCAIVDGKPVLGRTFVASKRLEGNLMFAWLALVGAAGPGIPRDESLKQPRVLDLSERRLPAWPDTAPTFASLHTLVLSRCWLDAVPGFVRELVELRELRLDGNQLDALAHLDALDALEKLDASQNRIAELPPEACRPALRHLDLRDNPIASISTGIRTLGELRTLLLRNAKLGTLPTIALPKLGRLEATRCGVQSIESLVGLTALETLDLRDNELRELPDLSACPALETLDVTHNRLGTLPRSIGDLPRLRRLRASYNPLAELPDTLGNASGLRAISVSDSAIAAMPASLGNLAGLRQLDVSRARLEVLDLRGLSSLRALDASHNQIGELDVSDCRDIASIVATDNIIAKIAGLADARSLEVLDLARNRMRALPKKVASMKKLRSVILSSNRLDALPDGPWPALVELDIEENRIRELPMLRDCLSLQKLVVSRNRLDAITAESLPKRLRILRAVDCNLSVLGGAFDELPLDTVDLRDNALTTVPAALWGIARVQEIDLRNNPLDEATRERIRALKHLYVRTSE